MDGLGSWRKDERILVSLHSGLEGQSCLGIVSDDEFISLRFEKTNKGNCFSHRLTLAQIRGLHVVSPHVWAVTGLVLLLGWAGLDNGQQCALNIAHLAEALPYPGLVGNCRITATRSDVRILLKQWLTSSD